MLRFSVFVLIVGSFLAVPARADDVATAVHGVISKVDAAAKTITVKTKDGTEHTIHFVDKTAVHGAEATEAGAKDSMHGLKEGSEVVAHYTEKGGEKTAVEVDRVGKDGVKTLDGTVSKVGKDGKTVAVKSADGTEHTFSVAGKDTAEAAKGIGKGSEKSAKVTVYYTEEAGKKVAHFFEKL
jgi:Cu/Ag efflux protein CusF